MTDTYKNIEEWNPNKKGRIFIVFDDMIADKLNNKKRNPIVTELFIRDRKLNMSPVFVAQSYPALPEDSRLNSTHYFIMKIQSKFQTNCVSSFIRYWLSRLESQYLINDFIKTVLQNIFSFS